MRALIQLALQKLWWLATMCLSESGQISFGRTMSGVISLYYLVQDAWFFHRAGHLIDNTTLLTQLSVMTAFYGVNKVTGAFSNQNDKAKETVNP